MSFVLMVCFCFLMKIIVEGNGLFLKITCIRICFCGVAKSLSLSTDKVIL